MIEQLTDEIARQAMEYIRKIDDMGGALASIEKGYMQGEIQESAYRYQMSIERNEQTIVGVNAFQVEEKLEMEGLAVDPTIEATQRANLAALRAKRDNGRVGELLSHLENAAVSQENLMPLFITCVENDITLGEICNVLRKVWGEYQAPALA